MSTVKKEKENSETRAIRERLKDRPMDDRRVSIGESAKRGRVGALACSRVPRACAHIAKGLNGLLIEKVSCTFETGGKERIRALRVAHVNLSRVSARGIYSTGWKIDRRVEQKGIIIPCPCLLFFRSARDQNVTRAAVAAAAAAAALFEEHFALVMHYGQFDKNLPARSSTSVARDVGSGIKVALFVRQTIDPFHARGGILCTPISAVKPVV